MPPGCATGISTFGRNPGANRRRDGKLNAILNAQDVSDCEECGRRCLLLGVRRKCAVQTSASLGMVPQSRLPAAAAAAAAVGSRRHFVTTVLWSPPHKIGVAVTGCASTGLAYEWLTALREPDWMGVANLWEGFGLCAPNPSSGPRASALLGCAVNGLDELIQGEMRLPTDRSFAKASRPMRPGLSVRSLGSTNQWQRTGASIRQGLGGASLRKTSKSAGKPDDAPSCASRIMLHRRSLNLGRTESDDLEPDCKRLSCPLGTGA